MKTQRWWAVLLAVTSVAAATGCAGGGVRAGTAHRAPMSAMQSRHAMHEIAATGSKDRDSDGIPDVADAKAKYPDERLAQNAPQAPVAPGQPQPAPVARDAHAPTMLIYTGEVGLAVFQVEQGMNAVERLGREVGGYLSVRGDQRIVIRVPRARFDEAIKKIEALGDVIHRNITAQDVTDEYVDLEVRLRNAHAMRSRLQELLKSANAVKDALEIEKELGRVTESIERMEGQMKLLRDKIAYSTITVNFQPVNAQSVPDTQMILPFPWLQELGLSSLLQVRQ